MSAQTLKVDRLARELPNRVAIWCSGFHELGEAEAIVRDLGEVFEAYELRLVTAERFARKTGARFEGRPMLSRFQSRCAVCAQEIREGSEILYSAAQRRAAHLACGIAA